MPRNDTEFEMEEWIGGRWIGGREERWKIDGDDMGGLKTGFFKYADNSKEGI